MGTSWISKKRGRILEKGVDLENGGMNPLTNYDNTLWLSLLLVVVSTNTIHQVQVQKIVYKNDKQHENMKSFKDNFSFHMKHLIVLHKPSKNQNHWPKTSIYISRKMNI